MLRVCLAVGIAAVFAGPAAAQTVPVGSIGQLEAAVMSARAGTEIVLANGTYRMGGGRMFTNNGGTRVSPIIVRAANANQAIIVTNGAESAFQIDAPYWTFDGLHIKVTNGSLHGFKLQGNGANVVIKNGKIELDSPAEGGIKGAGGPTAPQPDNVLIENNEIWFTSPTFSFNCEGIDAVAVANWVVRGNYIHDIQKDSTQFDGIGWGVFTKGNSQNTIIENNIVTNTFVSISLGGGGTGFEFFRNGDTTYEDRNGIIRNNFVLNSDDVAVYLNEANNVKIYNNTFFNSFTTCGAGCSSVDIRFAGSSADIRNNILDKPLNDRSGGTHTEGNNMMLPSPTDTSWFVNAAANDLRLRAGVPPIDQGATLADVTADIDGTARPQGGAYDIGAHERIGGVVPPPRDAGSVDTGAVTPPTDAGTGPAPDSGTTRPPADAGSTNPAIDAGSVADARTSTTGGGNNNNNNGGSARRGSTGGGCTTGSTPEGAFVFALLVLGLGLRRRRRE